MGSMRPSSAKKKKEIMLSHFLVGRNMNGEGRDGRGMKKKMRVTK